MLSGNTPGVYIQEISTLPASIASVPTAIPAFIGYTEKAEKDGVSLMNTPTRIASLLEYHELFGGSNPEIFAIAISDELDVHNNVLSRVISADLSASSPSGYNLYHSLQMFFNNGGGSCYIVSIGGYVSPFPSGATAVTSFKDGIDVLEKVDEPTLLVFPDATSLNDVDGYGDIVSHALGHCNKLQDRFTIIDANQIEIGSTFLANLDTFRGKLGQEYLKYGAAYFPFLQSTLTFSFNYDDDTLQKVTHTQTGGTTPPAPKFHDKTPKWINDDTPTIYRQILTEINKHHVTLPPSGAIAGIYARVDADRGVWKAPANVSLNGVIGPSVKLTNADQDLLNVDASTGKSINAIRTFAGKGTLVWGARTLAGNDNEWRYVPVRRLYIFVEESVKKATEFVVFEPNDANTWVRTKSMIENFLTKIWREGALAGAKPDDAFFVKVGLGETMTSDDVLNGIMNIEIGMAAVRPAEFIILKFSHKLQE